MATMVAKTEFAALRIIVPVKLDGKVQAFLYFILFLCEKMANFYSFLKFVKVPDVKLVFRCLDANEGHAMKLWNVIAKLSGLVLIVKYVSPKKFFVCFSN